MVLPERKLIEKLRRMASSSSHPAIMRGIGDDCAILRAPERSELLVGTDLCIEDVHFRRAWHPPESVGHRCLARGLSDIAAMGGEPIACFLSLGLPAGLPQRWVDGFLSGFVALARKSGAELSGGDISGAPVITADVVVIGHTARGEALVRGSARPGDLIYVTGRLGHSAAVLHRLFAGKGVRCSRSDRHFFPEPRLAVGGRLRRRKLARAMIDLSDGLSVDLAHICEESRVGAEIEAQAVPIATGATLEQALHGGDDYELLFTAAADVRMPRRLEETEITRIGRIVRSSKPRITLLDHGGRPSLLKPAGWQHFSKKY